MLVVATGFSKYLLERCFTLLVITGIFFQAGFYNFTRNWLVPNALSGGADPRGQNQYDGRTSAALVRRDRLDTRFMPGDSMFL